VIDFGKTIGAGIPGTAYGFTQKVADGIATKQELENCDVGGIGGTLAANALSLAAMRATLTKVLTQREDVDRYTNVFPGAVTELCQCPLHGSRSGDHE
jgi:glutamate-1-semialdehyde 2,1-aminomutase